MFGKSRGVKLAQFVRGIVHALTEAQQGIPHARERELNHHMTTAADGTLEPKLINIKLPDGRTLDVPTYALATVNSIGIASARVKCAARIIELSTEDAETGSMSCGNAHAVFRVDASTKGRDTFEMEIEFQEKDHSEAGSRIIDALNTIAEVND